LNCIGNVSFLIQSHKNTYGGLLPHKYFCQFNMLNLSFVLFHYLSKLVHLRNQLGMLSHIFYNQYNLLHVAQMQFVPPCTHPKVPSQEHHKGML